jgi:prevent-host-death family protein
MSSRLRNISVTQARKELGDVFSEVNYNKERVVLTNRKKRVAIVPIEDLERLEAMEDADDIREAQSALKEVDEQGSIPFDEMKKRLG